MSTSIYQPSIYSANSYTSPARSSSEHLLPAKLPKTQLQYSSPRGSQAGRTRNSSAENSKSAAATNGITIEQKKSYGIGGAGNIRRPSDVIYPPRTNADGARRHPGVWSSIATVSPGSSHDRKRTTLLNLFSRKLNAGEAAAEATEVAIGDEGAGFRDVDLGGRKH